MKNDVRVILILDPFRIAEAQGKCVQGLQEELKAFAEINKLLCANHSARDHCSSDFHHFKRQH